MSPETVEKTLRTQSEIIGQLRKDNERLRNYVEKLTHDLQDAEAIIMANKLSRDIELQPLRYSTKTYYVPRRREDEKA